MTIKSIEPPSPSFVTSKAQEVDQIHYFLPCYRYRSIATYYFGTPAVSKESALLQIQAASNIVSAFVIEFDLPMLPKPEN